MNYTDDLCFYDGVNIFIPGNNQFDQYLRNPDKFNLKVITDFGNKEIVGYTGNFQNLKIRTVAHPFGVSIHGSVSTPFFRQY